MEELRCAQKVCCGNTDVKNEGYVIVNGKKVWEYHCYGCDNTWTEVEGE